MDLNINFNDLDLENVGNWPPLVKGISILILCILTLGAGYYFDTQHQWQELERVRAKESVLKKDFETKQAKAANLDAYKQQMQEMKESFGTMLRQLPSKTEVPDLLVDITQTGLATGLEFELFQPRAEAPKEFYAELPISLRVTGGYHKFGEFVSGIAALPRIVTLHDISISGSDQSLVMNATAKTYRYLDEDEAK
ncbi:type IV pilus inner membrane component PilO [Thiohalomonas denitrificans]|uniref:Type IV pilus assembly protein PilO n=1 Tax=Thiohalomonas denitrificans TaxID=415747 RepID=A0A1G5QYN8_9GAMM|nr:type 4a pilus biogenesis protein PilO [Thiohalomonas denitrificans]SCZ66209.1 type IV pilus assembly protein PilO [Thiohalomonas denitrificans]